VKQKTARGTLEVRRSTAAGGIQGLTQIRKSSEIAFRLGSEGTGQKGRNVTSFGKWKIFWDRAPILPSTPEWLRF